LFYADLTDLSSLISVIQKTQPDEIYNLAAQSHVRISFDQPIYTAQVTGIGTLNMLEAVRLIKPDAKIYQASSSEMFGNSIDFDGFQRETTAMYPVSPYGCAKVYSYNICRNYRNSYNMFISNGILFNHESPRRGTNFVTNKVVKEAVKIKLGLSKKLALGNLDATRDWGHAKDYVEAMYLMLQQEKPSDFVIATGITTSIRDFVKLVFSEMGIGLAFSGMNSDEIGMVSHIDNEKLKQFGISNFPLKIGDEIISVDKRYFRPTEVELLIGDPKKAQMELNWKPKYSLKELVEDRVHSDIKLMQKEKFLMDAGPAVFTQNE
jgi:GDPmannose 4,6-dehydratase